MLVISRRLRARRIVEVVALPVAVELVIDLQGGMDLILMKQVKLYPQVAAFGFRQRPSRILLEKLRTVIAFLDEHATVFEYLVAVARGVKEEAIGAVFRLVRSEQVIISRPHVPVAFTLPLDRLVDIVAAVVEPEI